MLLHVQVKMATWLSHMYKTSKQPGSVPAYVADEGASAASSLVSTRFNDRTSHVDKRPSPLSQTVKASPLASARRRSVVESTAPIAVALQNIQRVELSMPHATRVSSNRDRSITDESALLTSDRSKAGAQMSTSSVSSHRASAAGRESRSHSLLPGDLEAVELAAAALSMSPRNSAAMSPNLFNRRATSEMSPTASRSTSTFARAKTDAVTESAKPRASLQSPGAALSRNSQATLALLSLQERRLMKSYDDDDEVKLHRRSSQRGSASAVASTHAVEAARPVVEVPTTAPPPDVEPVSARPAARPGTAVRGKVLKHAVETEL